MVHIVSADAMNTERWVNRWVCKNHIPAVTHLAVSTGAESGGREAFTVFRLSRKESHRIRVIRGLQGHPEVPRWMSVEGLHRYFRELTTEKGAVRVVEAGSPGMKGLQLGLRMKKVMDDLRDQGLCLLGPSPSRSSKRGEIGSCSTLSLGNPSRPHPARNSKSQIPPGRDVLSPLPTRSRKNLTQFISLKFSAFLLAILLPTMWLSVHPPHGESEPKVPEIGFPVNLVSEPDSRRLREILDDFSIFRKDVSRFESAPKVYRYLLDRIPLSATLIRLLKFGKYRITEFTEGRLLVDNQEGLA